MKDILCYIKENTRFKGIIGSANVKIEMFEDVVIVTCNNHIHSFNSSKVHDANYAVQDILEKYKTEVRFCDECGKPFSEGFMMEDGCWYICDDCFEAAMNAEYGEGKWRATDEEGSYGGFYEHLNDGDEWEDTGIFWTEWN